MVLVSSIIVWWISSVVAPALIALLAWLWTEPSEQIAAAAAN